MSGEFKDTKKALPLSLVMSIAVVAAVYILINTAYLKVLSPQEMAQTKTIASDIFMQLMGPLGRTVISLIVIISATGALNSTIMTGARIPFAVAQDYPRFGWFSRLNPKLETPVRCYLLNGLWAAALVLWGNFDQLLFFFALANWLFFALVGVSVFVLRNKNEHGAWRMEHGGKSFSTPGSMPHPPADEAGAPCFSMPGYPWVPVLFILSSVALCFITLFNAPFESIFGAVLLLLGLPVYFLLVRNK
jgi:APA family basic amino acid/polyamine antiporter